MWRLTIGMICLHMFYIPLVSTSPTFWHAIPTSFYILMFLKSFDIIWVQQSSSVNVCRKNVCVGKWCTLISGYTCTESDVLFSVLQHFTFKFGWSNHFEVLNCTQE